MSHQHLKIWNKVPFNTGESKYDSLTPYDENMNLYDSMASVFDPSRRKENLVAINNIQRLLSIPSGHISDKFDDEPYIVPFIVEGSKESVLLVPGGAYFDVSLDGEGYPSAEVLNELGMTCFVLKYRVYPYTYPAQQLDLRRAMCYLKANADKFGIDKDKISLIGFSAGGNLILSSTLLFREFPQIDGYEMDEIDKIDPTPATLSPIYAEALGDKHLTAISFGKRVYEEEGFFESIKDKIDLTKHIDKNTPPMFIMNCIDDNVVNPINTIRIVEACYRAKIEYEVHMFNEGGHGFGMKRDDIPPMYGNKAFNLAGTRTWPDLYVTWIKKILGKGKTS